MSINPETLKMKRGAMSQAHLAERAKVDRRTISRIETGEIAPDKVRFNTIDRLAKALNTTCEELAKAPDDDEVRDARLREIGLQKMSIYLDARDRLAFALVEKRYGISPRKQMEMAPLCMAILAEMSLRGRREAYEEAEQAIATATARLPSHLSGEAFRAEARFEELWHEENASVTAKDLFGIRLLNRGWDEDMFDPREDNPFLSFLRNTLRELGDEPASSDDLVPGRDGLPERQQVLDSYLDEVCAGNIDGRIALEEGHVRLAEIPSELWQEGRDKERGQWLDSRLPAARRLEIEELCTFIALPDSGGPANG